MPSDNSKNQEHKTICEGGTQSLETLLFICSNPNKLQPGYSCTSSLKTACLCKREPSGFTLELTKNTYIRFLNFCQTTGSVMLSACCEHLSAAANVH